MSAVRGLTVIVTTADPQRWDAALKIAGTQAALGGRARIYAHEAAVALIAPSDLLATARALGVAVIACQTGLADHGLALPADCEAGGLVSLLADLGDDRLVTL